MKDLDLTLATLIVLDRAVTLAFWELESNPLVESIGLVPWLLVSALLAALAVIVWRVFNLWEYRFMNWWLSGVIALYAFAVVSNVAFVLAFA